MYVVIDTETNGLAKDYRASYRDLHNWPRIIQLAWLTVYDSGKIKSKNSYIIKPLDFRIPKKSTQVHGITEKEALKVGKRFPFVIDKFIKDVSKSKRIVAHNLKFDWNVIASELFRNSVYSKEFFTNKRSCTMLAGIDVCKIPGKYGKYKWPTLQELHKKLFKKEFKGAHDALVDVRACHKCYIKLKSMNKIM
jgi:DNA polymerase III epsilon subunit-like protein